VDVIVLCPNCQGVGTVSQGRPRTETSGLTKRQAQAGEFDQVWKSSNSVKAVALKLGISEKSARDRAYRRRKKGVALRNLPSTLQ
jgi:hypothetical protein